MPRIDIEPKSLDDLDPPPRSVISITGDLRIMTLAPDEKAPDRYAAAFFTENTNAIAQNLHVLLDGKTRNYIIVEEDENGQVIVDNKPVKVIEFNENYNTQVKQPYVTPADPDA